MHKIKRVSMFLCGGETLLKLRRFKALQRNCFDFRSFFCKKKNNKVGPPCTEIPKEGGTRLFYQYDTFAVFK